MFNLAPIIAGCLASLLTVNFSQKKEQKTDSIQNNYEKVPETPIQNNDVKAPETYRFAFSEETVHEKMGKIAERFKLEMNFNKPYKQQYVYFISLIGIEKQPVRYMKCMFYIKITTDKISVSPGFDEYYFVLFDDSMPHCKACSHIDFWIDDDEYEYTDVIDTIGFSSDILFDDLSDDEIFDIIEKIIEALYGAESMKYETIEADDGRNSFIFYLDAPDYYGYTETTEIGNFKFILNKENGGN